MVHKLQFLSSKLHIQNFANQLLLVSSHSHLQEGSRLHLQRDGPWTGYCCRHARTRSNCEATQPQPQQRGSSSPKTESKGRRSCHHLGQDPRRESEQGCTAAPAQKRTSRSTRSGWSRTDCCCCCCCCSSRWFACPDASPSRSNGCRTGCRPTTSSSSGSKQQQQQQQHQQHRRRPSPGRGSSSSTPSPRRHRGTAARPCSRPCCPDAAAPLRRRPSHQHRSSGCGGCWPVAPTWCRAPGHPGRRPQPSAAAGAGGCGAQDAKTAGPRRVHALGASVHRR